MIKLKTTASEKRKELFNALLSVPGQYDDFLIMVLSYTHGKKNEQEVIDFINKQDNVTPSMIAIYVLQRDNEKWQTT
ncbi:MAG: hypothetical protein MSS24_06980 [Clostridiales bacterium]|jgi:hypothetical protein|nr:hypothetical protein [Clostridiales bacterium]